MNHLLAQFLVGIITGENDQFYYVQKEGITFALAKEEGPHRLGESVKGFAYVDIKQRPRLTTKEVTATLDHFGWGTVTDVRKDLGVFLDTGLPDKEVVVSLDILPEIKELWPKKGDQLYVRYSVDKKDRLWALPAFQEDFQKMAGPAYYNMQNQTLRAIVYRLKMSRFSEPRLGQELEVRVIGFRQVDRTLNLSLKPRSFEMLENDAQMILTYLESNGGFMTLNDKSSPDDIKAIFGISKGQFKKALGGLMKAGKIKQDTFETELK
ncbi:CvfB family protein [Streptococcus sp. X13SY08]|uniref:CvfB family protein n=1 Tax=Streptococcus sp. X13SY08 TaxID=1676616 RepID=UPI00066FF482|nr:S1 RNA-binding domain-containing protein [Streptococcus sp. X13SY08]